MTEQTEPLARNFFLHIWNAQGPRKYLAMSYSCGWILYTIGLVLLFFTKSYRTEGIVLNYTAMGLFLPMLIYGIIENHRGHKKFKRDMFELHIKSIVLETLFEIEEKRHKLHQELKNPSLKDWDLSPITIERKSNGSE
jgi:hypothetical protein